MPTININIYLQLLIKGQCKSRIHGETCYINFSYIIFQFREKRITLRIFVGKNTKLYNNDMKL